MSFWKCVHSTVPGPESSCPPIVSSRPMAFLALLLPPKECLLFQKWPHCLPKCPGIYERYMISIYSSPHMSFTHICLFSEKWPHCLRPLCSRNHHIWASYSARPLLRREIRRQERQCPYKEMSCCARYVWVSQIKALLHKFIHERWIFTSRKTFLKKSYKWIKNRKRTRKSTKRPIWKVKFRTPWHLNQYKKTLLVQEQSNLLIIFTMRHISELGGACSGKNCPYKAMSWPNRYLKMTEHWANTFMLLLYRLRHWAPAHWKRNSCTVETSEEKKQIKMCDDEIAALVVDNGSGMCKAGFAGDDAPR